ALRDPFLDRLPRRQRLARRDLPRRRPGAHHLESPLADADPAHAVMDAPRTEALLRQREPRAAPTQQCRLWNPAIFVANFRMRGPARARLAHHGNVSHPYESRRVTRH